MRKKVEYVSESLVKDEIKVFERKIIPTLEAKVSEKYGQHISAALLSVVTDLAWPCLNNSLYLTGSSFKRTRPSFRQQMCAVHDYMNLLRGVDEPLRFFDETNYWACYNGIATLLREKARFQKTQEISEEFWREIGSAHKENLSPEHAELYLNFVEEMTRSLTEAAVAMMSEQIQNIFPGQSAIYRQSLEGVYGSGIGANTVVAREEEITRVKFSL